MTPRYHDAGPGPDTHEQVDRADGHIMPLADWQAVVAEAERLAAEREAADSAS
jgi:hypothetical protein